MKVDLSGINFRLASEPYPIKEYIEGRYDFNIVSKSVRDFFVEKSGIETVYKSTGRKSDSIIEMYIESARKTLESSERNAREIGMLITANDNSQILDPAPTVELVSRLGLRSDVRTQNLQGMACSSLTEAIRSAAGHISIGGRGDVLVLIGSNYTDWFDKRMSELKKVSMKSKDNLNYLAYFLLFSDAAASALISSEGSASSRSVSINLDKISSRKDSSPDGYRKAYIKNALYSDMPDMHVDSKRLRETVATLSVENLAYLGEESPKIWNLHTAGKRFVDYVREMCGIEPAKCELTYDVMRKTGNTGAASSLQLINETLKRGILYRGEKGGVIDYGWEGADAFIYEKA